MADAKSKQTVNWGFTTSKLVKLADPAPDGLTGHEKAVLEAIADHMNDRGFAWPGYGTLCHFTALSRSTVIRTVKKLIARDILRTVDHDKDSNCYTVDHRAIAALVTEPKYKRLAGKHLERLEAAAEVNGRPVVPESTPSVHRDNTCGLPDTGGVFSGTTPVVSETPERTQERTHPNRSKNAPPPAKPGAGRGDLRSRQGEEGRLSDFINEHRVSELVAQVELMLTGCLAPSTRPMDQVAAATVSLLKEIEQEVHRLPAPEEVADAVGDERFRGLRGLSFGLLTSTNYRREFKNQILRRMANNKLATALAAPNAADGHDRAIAEAKREAVLKQQPRPLPHWLEGRSPDDPDVIEWVALNGPAPAAASPPATVRPAAKAVPERPIGYDSVAATIGDLLANLED